jgi:hypothetical protein
MTIVVENSSSFFFSCPVDLVNEDRDIASSWASSVINKNPAFKWIVGKYVEADNANSNGQYWSLEDLKMSRPTIQHAPMNMGHRQRYIVGTYAASELMYPTESEMNAYIETASVFWKYYFSEEFDLVQKAYDSGSLHQSMECVADSVTCAGPMGCGETFKYGGPMSDQYCEHIKNRESYRQLNNPVFLAGGLILPPDRPGWKNASIDDVASEELENVYEQVAASSPHLTPSQWEALMLEIVEYAHRNNDPVNDSHPSAAHLAKRVVQNIPTFL